jgi:Skp family chaperone for outer membrane proteins
MKTILKTAAALALATAIAAPASAQVSGIGVADPAVVVAGSKALQAAYSQISTTYSAQRGQLQTLDQQRLAILKKFDKNNDGRLDDAEQKAAQAANNADRKQLESVQDQIDKIQQPINMAGAYAVSQIAAQLNPAVQQVVSQGNVQLIIPSNTVIYAAAPANITEKIITALDQRLPTVSISPPAGWQPDQETVQLFQDVQQVRLAAAVRQQQAQQAAGAQPQQPAATSKPAPATPTKGR